MDQLVSDITKKDKNNDTPVNIAACCGHNE